MISSVRGLDQSGSYALRHGVRLQVQMSLWTREGSVESTPHPHQVSLLQPNYKIVEKIFYADTGIDFKKD
jgi:hypothetical protein